MTKEIGAFIDDAKTLVDRAIFTDEIIAKKELARVFTRSWLFLAHESQFSRAGDFFSTFMGSDPVLVTRQRDGSYKALLNSCRHRGMLVCRTDYGNTAAFTCPYHGWAYGTDGSLAVVGEEATAYGSFDKSEWGLITVPRVESYKGLIFGCWEPDTVSLVDYLGDMVPYLDVMLDGDGDGVEVVPGVHKWRLDGNWKLAAEQFAGDMYHAGFTHLSALVAEAADRPDPGPRAMEGFQVAMPQGHGLGGYDSPFWHSLPAEAADWMDNWVERNIERVGQPIGSRGLIHGTVFPNFSLLWNRWNIRVWHPKGPNHMDCWSWGLVPRNAPDVVKKQLTLDYQRHFSPAGTWEQDDGEQWAFSARGEGFMRSTVPLNYQMGLDRAARSIDGLPGQTDSVYSEIGQRAFYGRWTELMAVPHPKERKQMTPEGVEVGEVSV